MGERRHRIRADELGPVKVAIHDRLILLLDERSPDELENAANLFRLWYRIENYITHKPAYPDHSTYAQIGLGMGLRYRNAEGLP